MKSNLKIKLLTLLLFFTSWVQVHAQQVEVITGAEERTAYQSKNYLIVNSLSLKPGFTFKATAGTSFYAKVHPNAVPPTAPSADQNFVLRSILLDS